MLSNYCRIILRHLHRNRGYTLINILSLGIAIAAMIWGIQVYRFNTSYDQFHLNRDRIFRVLITVKGSDGIKGTCPAPIAAATLKDYPNIEKAVRWQSRPMAIQPPGKEPISAQTHFTDPAFFEMFSFPLTRGHASLADPATILLTETAAKKYFGDADPLGKTLTLYSDQSYKRPLTVTGIIKDIPANSSFQFETLTSTENFLYYDGSAIKNNDWAHLSDALFLQLKNPRQASRLAKAFDRYIPLEQAARQDIKVTSFTLQSLSQTALETEVIDVNTMLERPGDAGVYAPLILAILILLSACLNFANTTVAQSRRRLKEIGVRKVMGSSIQQIIIQQLLECALIVLPAIGLSMILTWLWLPAYNGLMIHMDIHARYTTDPILLITLLALLVLVILLAGAYPAIYISRFNATNIFRGSVKFGGRNLFSRLLLTLQIVITFITLITSIAFARNAAFQRDYDYGYHVADIMGVILPQRTAGKTLHDELSRLPGIQDLAGTRDHIGFSYHSWPLEAEGKKNDCAYFEVAPGYTDLMGLHLIAGALPANAQDMLINEKFAYAMGWQPNQAIGKNIHKDDKTTCRIVGVLKDFTQNSFSMPIQPLAMCYIKPDEALQWIIRTKPGHQTEVANQLKAIWSRLYPATPLNMFYQDEVSAMTMRLNAIITRIFSGFALISIFMAATGMFALVSLTILKRLREIAIRRIVGAQTRHILKLIGKSYGYIFLIGATLGSSIGFLLARQLMNMVFRINAGVRTDSIIISVLAIAALTGTIILTRIIYLARMRTTEILKTE